MAKSSRFLFAALAATCLTVPAVIKAAPAEKSWPMVEGDLGNGIAVDPGELFDQTFPALLGRLAASGVVISGNREENTKKNADRR